MGEIFSKDGIINIFLENANNVIWTYFLIWALILCGLWFTWKTHFVQFRMAGEMIRLLADSAGAKQKEKHISSFQAFSVSIATRVGTGNLAGVATAIAIGGPGAVFWMWVIALIGSATSFIESTLAQLYKRPNKDSFIGGPAYYIERGLGKRWMAMLFSSLMILTFGLSYNSVQANTICGAMQNAFGWDPLVVGAVIAAISMVIALGGIQRIAKVSSVVVPFMAIGYLILAVVIIIMNITLLPAVLKAIVENAFGVVQIGGGTLGATMMNGIKRGLFSNEAGEGSAPHAAATALCTHPVKQGLIQALGVFTDTLLVCSCTAFIILISGLYTDTSLKGIGLTQAAMDAEVGQAGTIFVALAILLFAWSSIIGNDYYGESNIRFLTSNKTALQLFRVASTGVMVMFGAAASLDLVWSLGDICMALITIVNLTAILFLAKYVFRSLDDYMSQKRKGIKEPVFHADSLPEIKDDLEAWK